MKIYVATAFVNRLEARELIATLRKAGHEVTHDWTHDQVQQEWPAEKQAAYLRECGNQDARGVMFAEALVLINHTEARDAMSEFGMALGMCIPVHVLYPERRGSVFFHRTAGQHASIPELLDALRS